MAAPNSLIEALKKDEGLRLTVYKDTLGVETCGYGHNLVANPLPGETYPLSLERAEQILRDDVARLWNKLLEDEPWISALAEVYQGVVGNMCFELGDAGVEAFHDMLYDMKTGDYKAAAAAGRKSKWYREVPERAERLMQQLEEGIWK